MTKTFLEEYGGQTLEELITMETSHRIDSLVLAMESALGQKLAARGASSLSTEERIILAIEALEREVNNGGYDQFFVNSSRIYAAEIENALRAIGCAKQADIARRAVAALKIDGAITPGAVEAVIYEEDDERDQVLGALDKEYYSCSEPIADQLFDFVKAHRGKIRLR